MAKEETENKQEAKKSGLPLGLILKVVFVIINLSVSGGGAYLTYLATLGIERRTITEEEELEALKAKVAEEDQESVIYTMDSLTVNLSGFPRRIIRAVISLEMMDGRGFEEVVRLGAVPRDRIVKTFSDKTFSDIETIQGKLNLKAQIADIVNNELKEGVVKDVFFNELVVQ